MSGFDRESTVDEVLDGIDLSGRVFVVTGSSSGLGEESARGLSARGAHIIMAARDAVKNAEAAERIHASVPDADLSVHELDLADLSSVARFAEQAADGLDRVDVLINNAGVMCCGEGRTADGFETQLGTNGGYLADCGPTVPGPGDRGYEPWIDDATTAGRLWELSERLVGLSLDQA